MKHFRRAASEKSGRRREANTFEVNDRHNCKLFAAMRRRRQRRRSETMTNDGCARCARALCARNRLCVQLNMDELKF